MPQRSEVRECETRLKRKAIVEKNGDWGRRWDRNGLENRPVKSSPDYFHSTVSTQVLNPKKEMQSEEGKVSPRFVEFECLHAEEPHASRTEANRKE